MGPSCRARLQGELLLQTIVKEWVYIMMVHHQMLITQIIPLPTPSWGLFLNGAHETTSSGNTIYNCARGYYLLNYNSSIGIANNTVSNNIFVARMHRSTQHIMNLVDLQCPSSFSANNNIYARPIDDNATIWRDGNGTNYYNTLAQWKTYSGQDAAFCKISINYK